MERKEDDQTGESQIRKREIVEPVNGSEIQTGEEINGWRIAEVTRVSDPNDPPRFNLLFTQERDGRTHRITYSASGVDISRTGVEAWLRRNEGDAVEDAAAPRWQV